MAVESDAFLYSYFGRPGFARIITATTPAVTGLAVRMPAPAALPSLSAAVEPSEQSYKNGKYEWDSITRCMDKLKRQDD